MARALVLVAVASCMFAAPATASAAVTASEDATTITVTGTAGDDLTTLADDGANVRIANATAGANCVQSGADALCPRGARTISADLAAGNDDLDNQSTAEAAVSAGTGADLIMGRLRSADGGGGKDVIRTRGMTGVVSLGGGDDFDVYDIGANTGAADIIGDSGGFMVDYLSRPAASGGVTVRANNAIADDGAAGEFDNVGGATHVRGTVNADNLTGSASNADILDGELGADTIDGGDSDPTIAFAGNTLRADALVFGMDAQMPYARPASANRTAGVTADLRTGTSSDGDILTRIDDLRGTAFGDVLRTGSDRDVVEAGGGAGKDDVATGGDEDVVSCDGSGTSFLFLIALVKAEHGGAAPTPTNGCTLTVDAGAGDDAVVGGRVGDSLRGGAGDDTLTGGEGNDLIVPGPGADRPAGSNGNDTISFAEDLAGVTVTLAPGGGGEASGTGFENVVGSPFNDSITGDGAGNALDGGAGTDTVSFAGRTAGMVIDLQVGTAGSGAGLEDRLAAFENVTGTSGPDTLVGSAAANLMQGGDGDDTLRGGLGADLLIGGNGADTADFDHLPAPTSAGDTGITHTIGGPAAGNTEGDLSLEIEGLAGSGRADVLIGTSGADTLSGGDGDDRLAPGAGTDTVRGGSGTDTLDYASSPVAIHAHLTAVGGLEVREFAATATKDTLADELENLVGSPFADVLRGSGQANDVRGGGGSDVIDGRAGDDVLRGDGGNDRFGTVAGSVQETATAAQVTVGNGSSDGRDTVFGGVGNDDVNVRDGALDDRVDCSAGTDIARQDLLDDGGDLDIDACETIETTAVDQRAMTRIRRVVKLGKRRLRLTLSCPRRSRVACKGKAGLVRSASARVRRGTRYRMRKGRRMRVVVAGRGRYIVLAEKDQRGRKRRLARRR